MTSLSSSNSPPLLPQHPRKNPTFLSPFATPSFKRLPNLDDDAGKGAAAGVGGAGVHFRKTSWKIETWEAERVGVEGVGKAELKEGKRKISLVPNLTNQRNALQMLSNRTQIVFAYVRGVSEETMKQDSEILSMISGLTAGLPGSRRPGSSREELLTE